MNTDINRPKFIESTAAGAAYLAAYSIGLWSLEEIREKRKIDAIFGSEKDDNWREIKSKRWNEAVKRTMNWVDQNSDS